MSMIVFNPTNEDLTAMHGGCNLTIKKFPEKGHKMKLDDAKAKHLLNILGPRGLTVLEYDDALDGGDKENQKAEDGRERNRQFKIKQVTMYNQDNESRKAQKLGYVDPPPHITEYSKELGIGIIAPYQVQDLKNEEISVLKKEKAEDAAKMKDMTTKFNAMYELLQNKGMLMSEEEEEEAEIAKVIQEYKMMKPPEFKKYVLDLGLEEYGDQKIAVQQDMQVKWGRFFDDLKKDPFPY
jgi:hypothetical protein